MTYYQRRSCRDCGEPVIRARTEALHWQLLNAEPDPAGNVMARTDGNGNWYARSVPPGTKAVAPERLYMPHPATCTGKRPAVKTAELPAGVTSLTAWRNRRRGGKRVRVT